MGGPRPPAHGCLAYRWLLSRHLGSGLLDPDPAFLLGKRCVSGRNRVSVHEVLPRQDADEGIEGVGVLFREGQVVRKLEDGPQRLQDRAPFGQVVPLLVAIHRKSWEMSVAAG